MGIRILLADDHKIVRDGLRSLIERHADMTVAAEAATGRSAVDLAGKHRPDVVVMDIHMPDLNGIDATRKILAALPDIKVVAFSMHTDEQFVVGALKAGVSGYLQKDCAFAELEQAIRSVVAGQTYLSPRIARSVVNGYLDMLAAEESGNPKALSDRERETVQLYAEGHSTRQIADRLGISVKAVEGRRRHIMDKLEISSIPELVKFAVRAGIITLDD